MRAIVHERRALRIRGVVQGVGFRPFVFRVATALGLCGSVCNDGEGVWIEVEGPAEALDEFVKRLRSEAPPLSRIEGIEATSHAPVGETAFRIDASGATRGAAHLPADVATCDACLQEVRTPSDRRYRYPFTNCTDCGPRFTIARELPWDRPRTTMSSFPLCAECRAEYEDPSSRRFHAEPNACPACGPRLLFRTAAPGASGSPTAEKEEALRRAQDVLASGGVVAVKGLGGFFLAVDARDDAAVRRLRERKHRPHKPFAVMVRGLEEANALCELDAAARSALTSPAHPIVLLQRRTKPVLASSVAPALRELGVVLAYTPLHHLLLDDQRLGALVMTSGNVSDEPIARSDEEAFRTLSGIADAFLFHDREIHARADDSVVRIVHGAAQPVRRARGFVPESIALPFDAPPVIAVGPQLKNTVCFTRGAQALLSAHIGDLDHPEAFAFFEESIAKLSRLAALTPRAIAHDLHPDYVSTRWARECGLPTIAVQHHHAHVASCLAEHGRTDPVIGIAFDGTGCGPAGDLWGGEILVASLRSFRRVAHLRALPLPGGEIALRQVWRLGLSAARDARLPLRLPGIAAPAQDAVEALLAHAAASPRATGAGRWFDAVAAIMGVRHETTYEGQAAVELEALALGDPEALHAPPFPYDVRADAEGVEELDLRPMTAELARALEGGVPRERTAARFHATLAHAATSACLRASHRTRITTVALTGGCFQNRLLTDHCAELLERAGLEVLIHRKVPPNDGGLALGQAAIAAWQLAEERNRKEDADVSRDPR